MSAVSPTVAANVAVYFNRCAEHLAGEIDRHNAKPHLLGQVKQSQWMLHRTRWCQLDAARLKFARIARDAEGGHHVPEWVGSFVSALKDPATAALPSHLLTMDIDRPSPFPRALRESVAREEMAKRGLALPAFPPPPVTPPTATTTAAPDPGPRQPATLPATLTAEQQAAQEWDAFKAKTGGSLWMMNRDQYVNARAPQIRARR